MSLHERLELILIPACGLLVWLIAPSKPLEISLGKLFLYVFALLLLQGLVRDVWLLTKAKHTTQPIQDKAISGICLESTIGIVGIAIGSALLFSQLDFLLVLSSWMWGLLVFVIMSIGFMLKDYVFVWGQWTIYREKNHANILFTWKSK